ncbi:hypothetical protein ACN6MY_12565 [Peribacillus sp. B-H-3]|uniref:hypothetical protein n=1 Tax=Peribacillus sp. B-H-3 TaxID=3400420 RepID=UPI003B019FDC
MGESPEYDLVAETALSTLKLCHTKEPDRKKKPLIDQIRKSKGYKKANEKIKMINVVWDKEEGYSVKYFRRERNGSYVLKSRIDLGDTFIPGELADAIRKGIELATF